MIIKSRRVEIKKTRRIYIYITKKTVIVVKYRGELYDKMAKLGYTQ